MIREDVCWCGYVEAAHGSMPGQIEHEFEPARAEAPHATDCVCLACVPVCAPPTKAEFDALPPRWRRYVADLETLADPAGMVRENALLRDRIAQLEAAVAVQPNPNADVPLDADETKKALDILANPPPPTEALIAAMKRTAARPDAPQTCPNHPGHDCIGEPCAEAPQGEAPVVQASMETRLAVAEMTLKWPVNPPAKPETGGDEARVREIAHRRWLGSDKPWEWVLDVVREAFAAGRAAEN